MEENQSQKKLYGFLQMAVYGLVVLDVLVNVYKGEAFLGMGNVVLQKFSAIVIFSKPLYFKLFTLLLICLVGIGTLAKKKLDINVKNHIVYPLVLGLLSLFSSILFLTVSKENPENLLLSYTDKYELAYIILSFLGAILTLVAIDNISKIVKSGFGKDKWNVEGESFMQETIIDDTPYSINLPTQFYYDKKIHNGYININPFRGTIVIGTPGSGKSFGVINPAIRQLIKKGFTMCLYDFKFPDLGKIAYYHYCLGKQQGRLKNHNFHVINLNDVEKSNRINPLNSKYVNTLAEASEIAEAMVEALKKGDRGGGGADQFFTQSAINFLASSIYFLAKYEKGKYSSLPHLLAFINKGYEEIFTVLYSNTELHSLLSPFYSAFEKKAFDQLEGQIGTLKVFISRLATKESFWVFSDDDFNLKISDPENPSILILANDPATQNINSALYSLVLNRMLKLINSKNNLPTSIVVDEVPTLYIHKIENLIATARSNKVAVLLGLQELPQFKQQYGKETADSINSIVGNILSGSVRNKETLDWLERLFGKVKQKGEGLSIDRNKTSVSYNEKLDALIPAGKIASLRTGEMVGIIAKDVGESDFGNYKTSAVNCKINLNLKNLKIEEDNYKELPNYYDFGSQKDEILFKNFKKINDEITFFVKDLMEEILSNKN
ncbi:type IV secretion system DNA-binding domain-containing protein [Flavobacterium daejeonense]|uniref:type IV secretion system DNA-binding domain-containing protein n=1 Tax=Flavobacterium daejeonense TaxID=350893 RepID=UPI000478A454|nr:type IV secretion system DNA-binding domain-containing protein [Flavobacterium daejeonense]